MQAGTKGTMIRRTVDIAMTVLLLFLMAYQVTGEMAHEWTGMVMTVLVIIHQILNRKWYSAVFKGRYNLYRTVTTAVNILLLASFAVTAVCGMSMSGYAVPFLYGILQVSTARRLHLSVSHWAFVLMGLHLGLHVPVIAAKLKLSAGAKKAIAYLSCIAAGVGLYLFLRNGMPDYLFFRVPFAFLDYEKPGVLVLLENGLMLLFWVFAGCQAAALIRKNSSTDKTGKLRAAVFLMAAVILGLVLQMMIPADNTQGFAAVPGSSDSKTPEPSAAPVSEPQTSAEVNDDFIRIEGGEFLMGSPDSENWRIDDETQHRVRVSSFYMDAYETTQAEYTRLMGESPFMFAGENLPAENITWFDTIRFANAKSKDAGLTPVYTETADGIEWDTEADGYRLPTEAEWEYACRAGTLTPFNTEKSLSADDANFYGHYPYEIEENYFNNSVLEAGPGEYRQKTLPVGSFAANAWGLYDCHGNVNEWCWDYYGLYDADADDPSGPETGTRHVYRGGGWNDFAKNMRSAYRAAGQADMAAGNLGVRLVRNAEGNRSGTVRAAVNSEETKTGGKILIAYFSWGGNTRGVAEEIRKQTGADMIEITPVTPYSTDYNTVLMEAQEDQHRQARPELSTHVENMEAYDVILLGYPNWWASIPMPIASFLEEYDFAGKRIIPFCSHGGGRFGQSLTAIAKLAPDADMGRGLSVHYSGGSSLPDDVTAWLDENGIER
ncbi:MAG: SUMF1/EgtB/PvdO family nonheme iron enzyme [Solobacterium sp.]|nr:SUMF1/EgtB/PvdO family nonheme iron enzyme [Solobacterium sp.]